ncbi:hypothetical protein AQS70_11345 [Pseudomonas endophytica]|uniref:Uncharacterized protein n=1 Tax=Pseudomonas endophytica TaxID=1563157 RepID=A0A0Q0YVG6_9PSED|nr:hypothetical protein [Pseudomonas endophytica]KQB53229.1 hypothetical protein AQS70_11345 [Pseudomonas endophytica]
MPIELTLIPDGSIRTCALSDTRDSANVDLEGLFPKFPALDGTFAIFWLSQLKERHIVGFSTEGSNLLAVISLPTVPDRCGWEQYYISIMERCYKERESILSFVRKSLSFEGINGRCVRSFILYKLIRQLQVDSVPVWEEHPHIRDGRCGAILIGGSGTDRYEPNRKIDVVFGSNSSACLVIDLGEWRWN